MTRRSLVRGGWSRTVLPISPDMLVIDVGSGAFPNARADVLCDRDPIDNRHRAGLALVIDRPMIRADATVLPFAAGSVDFVIVSHLAEHVDHPAAFCAELARVARAGFLETPSPLADYLLDEEYHIWRVGRTDGRILFRRKRPKPGWVQRLCDEFYRVFYSAQPSCHRPTRDLPPGLPGRALGGAVKAFGAVLNRLGLMHTRILFDSTRPLRWRVEQPDGTFVNGPDPDG